MSVPSETDLSSQLSETPSISLTESQESVATSTDSRPITPRRRSPRFAISGIRDRFARSRSGTPETELSPPQHERSRSRSFTETIVGIGKLVLSPKEESIIPLQYDRLGGIQKTQSEMILGPAQNLLKGMDSSFQHHEESVVLRNARCQKLSADVTTLLRRLKEDSSLNVVVCGRNWVDTRAVVENLLSTETFLSEFDENRIVFKLKYIDSRQAGTTFIINISTNVQYTTTELLEIIKDDIHLETLQEALKLLLNLPPDYETITLEAFPALLASMPVQTVFRFDAQRGIDNEFLRTLNTYLWLLVEDVVVSLDSPTLRNDLELSIVVLPEQLEIPSIKNILATDILVIAGRCIADIKRSISSIALSTLQVAIVLYQNQEDQTIPAIREEMKNLPVSSEQVLELFALSSITDNPLRDHIREQGIVMRDGFIIEYLQRDLIRLFSSLKSWLLEDDQDTFEFETKPPTDKESVKKLLEERVIQPITLVVKHAENEIASVVDLAVTEAQAVAMDWEIIDSREADNYVSRNGGFHPEKGLDLNAEIAEPFEKQVHGIFATLLITENTDSTSKMDIIMSEFESLLSDASQMCGSGEMVGRAVSNEMETIRNSWQKDLSSHQQTMKNSLEEIIATKLKSHYLSANKTAKAKTGYDPKTQQRKIRCTELSKAIAKEIKPVFLTASIDLCKLLEGLVTAFNHRIVQAIEAFMSNEQPANIREEQYLSEIELYRTGVAALKEELGRFLKASNHLEQQITNYRPWAERVFNASRQGSPG